MIYEVTFKVDGDNIQELEDIFDRYNIEYKLNEVSESEV